MFFFVVFFTSLYLFFLHINIQNRFFTLFYNIFIDT